MAARVTAPLPSNPPSKLGKEYAAADRLRDFSTDRRLLLLAAMALVVGTAGAAAAWALAAPDQLGHQSRLFRPRQRRAGLNRRQCAGSLVCAGSGGRLPDHWPDGPLWVREDPRSRHPGGNGGYPDRPQPDPRQGSAVEAALLGDLDWHGRSLRRRRPDHHDRRRFRSLFAQFFHLSNAERKTLLVAGAAAGMAATFGTPVAAMLLAVELLLFEWKPRSFVPVAIACLVAVAWRPWLMGGGVLFPMAISPELPRPA